MTAFAIALLVVAGIAGVAVLIVLPFLLSYLLLRLFGRTSGLNKVAELYPATAQLGGSEQGRQWVAVGKVYYRKASISGSDRFSVATSRRSYPGPS